MIEHVAHCRLSLVTSFVALFEVWASQAEDLAVCYIRGQHVQGPPGWTERRDHDGSPLGTLFWKILSPGDASPRFTSGTPIDQNRSWGAVYRGVELSVPVEPGSGVDVLG